MATHDYRVRVKYPWLPGSDQSFWARMATFSASFARMLSLTCVP